MRNELEGIGSQTCLLFFVPAKAALSNRSVWLLSWWFCFRFAFNRLSLKQPIEQCDTLAKLLADDRRDCRCAVAKEGRTPMQKLGMDQSFGR